MLPRSAEVPRVPDDDGIDQQAKRRRPIELRLIFAVREAALLAVEEHTGQVVEQLPFVQAHQHASAERLVIDELQDVPCLADSPQLLDRLPNRVLSLRRL